MQTDTKDELLLLIQSMTKAERRQFSIRNRGTKKVKLFNAIQVNKDFEDPQLHNLRADLYKQILQTMHDLTANKSAINRMSQEMEQARILIDKKLFRSAFRLIQKIKKEAVAFNQVPIRFQVLGIERELSIRQAIEVDVDRMQYESNQVSIELSSIQHWSNILMLLSGWFARNGHVLNKAEKEYVDKLVSSDQHPTGFYATLYSWQARTLHAFICNENHKACQNNWIGHFEDHSQMISLEPLQYKKAKDFGIVEPSRPAGSLRDTAESIEQYYIFGKLLFDENKYGEALDYINPIVHIKGFYRTDLQIAAGQMQIAAHEKLGNDSILDSLDRSLKRFIKKRQDINPAVHAD